MSTHDFIPAASRRDLEQTFREKWGREPGPDDPLFWRPGVDHPVALPDGMANDFFEKGLRAMEDAGLMPAAWFYAARKCERMVMPQSREKYSEEELRAWDAAVAEYEAVMPSGEEMDYIYDSIVQAADIMLEVFDSWTKHVAPPSNQIIGEIGLFASMEVVGQMMRRALILHPDRGIDELAADMIETMTRIIDKVANTPGC